MSIISGKLYQRDHGLVLILVMLMLLTAVVVESVGGTSPETPLGHTAMGLILFGEESYQEAVVEFGKAIELDPTFTAAYSCRGDTYYNIKDYEKAIKDYSKVIELAPNHEMVWRTYYTRGLSYSMLGKYDEAIRDFDTTIKKNSSFMDAYFARGTVYGRIKQYTQSISDYSKVIEMGQVDPQTYYQRGLSYALLGNDQAASQDLKKVMELAPPGSEWYQSAETLSSNLNVSGTEGMVLSQEWKRVIKGTGAQVQDIANAVQQTSDGGYIISGERFNTSSIDAFLTKLDSDGNEIWMKMFNGKTGGYDYAASVHQCLDGGYILAGQADGQAWVLKTDGNGIMQWENNININTDYSYTEAARQTSDGGYVVVGGMWPPGAATYFDALLVKIGGNGTQQWYRTFGERYNQDYAHSVLQMPDGGYIIVGEASAGLGSEAKGWLIRTDSFGKELWNKTFYESEGFYSIRKTSDGGYVTVGRIYEPSGIGKSFSVVLVKIDSKGNKLWSNTYEENQDCEANTVYPASNGDIILSGNNCLLRTDRNGKLLWKQAPVESGENIWLRAMEETRDGGYVLVGYQASSDFRSSDVWIGKYSKENILASQQGNTRSEVVTPTPTKIPTSTPKETPWVSITDLLMVLMVVIYITRNRG